MQNTDNIVLQNDIFFSVIIPIYNREKFIARAVDSVLKQEFENWELILVNDASTDSTKEIIDSISHPKVKVIHNEVNQERCVCRNIGIKASKGKYICFLDSDDYHLSNHLKILYDEIQKKGEPQGIFFTNAWDEDTSKGRSERVCPNLENYNLFHYILTYTFNPQRTAVHHSIFDKFLFDPQVPGVEDLDLFLRIATNFPVFQIKERTTVYVMHENAYTMSKEKPAKELRNFTYIFNKPDLKQFLPKESTNRLLSMCYFHLALQIDLDKNPFTFYNYAFKSFVLCPKGYNQRTNKILFVNMIYAFPLLGGIIKAMVKNVKEKK